MCVAIPKVRASLPDAHFKSHSACGRNVEAVDLVRHGDAERRNRSSQRCAARPSPSVPSTSAKAGCQPRLSSEMSRSESASAAVLNPAVVTNASRAPTSRACHPESAPDASPGNPEHRAHGNAHSATIQRIKGVYATTARRHHAQAAALWKTAPTFVWFVMSPSIGNGAPRDRRPRRWRHGTANAPKSAARQLKPVSFSCPCGRMKTGRSRPG